jgi:hypothetical protein
MTSTTNTSKTDKNKINVFNQKITNKQKDAKNGEWFEEIADMMVGYQSGMDIDLVKKMQMNYDLYNSRGQATDYNDLSTLMSLQQEGVGGTNQTRTYDIISSIASSMVGDQEKRPFVPICVDISENGLNEIKRKRQELVQQRLQSKIIQPIIDQVTQQIQEEMAAQAEVDPETGEPMIGQEQQQQAQEQIGQQVEAMTPEEIHRYMSKDFKGASSIQGQKIMEYYLRELKLKYKFTQAFKNLIITGLPIMYGGIRNGKVVAEVVKPTKFRWGGSENIDFIEDGDWWVYEENISFPEVYKRYGSILTKKDQEKLDEFYDTFYANTSVESYAESKLVSEVALDPNHYGLENADLLTKKGQSKMRNAYEKVFYGSDGTAPVVHHHIVFKSLTLFKYITRLVEGEDGETSEELIWFDGEYEFNPLNGDIEEKEVWLPQLYEVVKLHYGSSSNAVYLLKRPIPDQHRSLDNPFDIKGPYYGLAWNSFHGESKFLAPLDKAKPYIYDYNVIRSKINHLIKSDRGKLLMTSFASKPKDWTWGKWMGFFKEGLALIDTTNMSPHEAQLFKEINLSGGASELAGYLQYLEQIKRDASEAMSYNPSRLGQISPYMTVTNNQQNIMQSLSQTEDLYTTFNKIQENFLTHLMRLSKTEFRENPAALTYLLDDMSIAELETDESTLTESKFGVYVSNSGDDQENLNMTKTVLATMVQAQVINYPEYMKSLWTKSAAEAINIAEEAEKRRQSDMQSQRDHEQQMQQQAMEAQDKREQMIHQRAVELKQMDIDAGYEKALIDAMTFANQKDIDQDMVNDDLEMKEKEIEATRDENNKNRVLQLEMQQKQIEADLLQAKLKAATDIQKSKLKPKTTK